MTAIPVFTDDNGRPDLNLNFAWGHLIWIVRIDAKVPPKVAAMRLRAIDPATLDALKRHVAASAPVGAKQRALVPIYEAWM